jgi:hypothetical protein
MLTYMGIHIVYRLRYSVSVFGLRIVAGSVLAMTVGTVAVARTAFERFVHREV